MIRGQHGWVLAQPYRRGNPGAAAPGQGQVPDATASTTSQGESWPQQYALRSGASYCSGATAHTAEVNPPRMSLRSVRRCELTRQ